MVLGLPPPPGAEPPPLLPLPLLPGPDGPGREGSYPGPLLLPRSSTDPRQPPATTTRPITDSRIDAVTIAVTIALMG
jgi:hypothetical protein